MSHIPTEPEGARRARVSGRLVPAGLLPLLLLSAGCSERARWQCQIPAEESPPAVAQIGCEQDFLVLASEPLAPSIPGARSVKTSIDREHDAALSFQNSARYAVHWDYLSQHRSVAQGLTRVPPLDQFNRSEYSATGRRFLLGALTHYEGPDKWAYEIAPYDTADTAMIRQAFEQIAEATFLGDRLYFHPTSINVEQAAAGLPRGVPQLSTNELFAGIDYQALNLGESIGQLRFVAAAERGWRAAHDDPAATRKVLAEFSENAGLEPTLLDEMLAAVNAAIASEDGAVGRLDPAAYDRTVNLLLTGAPEPILTAAPDKALSDAVMKRRRSLSRDGD